MPKFWKHLLFPVIAVSTLTIPLILSSKLTSQLNSNESSIIDKTAKTIHPHTIDNLPYYPIPPTYTTTPDEKVEYGKDIRRLFPNYFELAKKLNISGITENMLIWYTWTDKEGKKQKVKSWPDLTKHGWTYEKFFLSSEVCNKLGINKDDPFNLKNLYDKLNVKTKILDLNGAYKSNPYRDEIIKVWLNPIFIHNVNETIQTSFFDLFNEINFANNDLWYFPLLGWDTSKTGNKQYSLFINKRKIKTAGIFANLLTVDFRNNNFTTLPHIFDSSIGKIDASLWLNKTNNDSKFYVDGNCFGQDPRTRASSIFSLQYKFASPNVFVFNTWNERINGKTHSNQSNAFFDDNNWLDDLVKKTAAEKLKLKTIDELKGVDLDSVNEDINELYPNLSKNKNTTTVGAVLSCWLIKFLNDNYLASDYIYNQYESIPIFVDMFDPYCLFAFNNYEAERWIINLPIQIYTSQVIDSVTPTKDGDYSYNVSYLETFPGFYSYQVAFFTKQKTMAIVFGSAFTVSALFLIWIAFYYGYLRKKIVSQRKTASISQLKEFEENK